MVRRDAELIIKRVERFVKWRDEATSSQVAAECDRALVLTDAVVKYQDRLAEALASNLERERRRAEATHEAIASTVDAIAVRMAELERRRLEAQRVSASYDETLDRETLGALSTALVAGHRAERERLELEAHGELVDKVGELQSTLTTDVFEPDVVALGTEVSRHFLEIVGSIACPPAGQVYELVKHFTDVRDRNDQSAEAADRTLAYIDNYCRSLVLWGAAAEHLIRRLDPAAGAKTPPPVSTAA